MRKRRDETQPRRPSSEAKARREAQPTAPPDEVEAWSDGRAAPDDADAALRETVIRFARFLTTAPIFRLPPELREAEVQRRLRNQVELLEDTLRDGADVAERLPRLKALNVAHALRVALEQGVIDQRLDELDQAACRFIDAAGAVVPVPGRQGRLSRTNRDSTEKHQLLSSMATVMDDVGVSPTLRRDGRIERRDIEAQWAGKDADVPPDEATAIAAFAQMTLEAVLLRVTTRPVAVEPTARVKELRAVARAVRLLIELGIASPQNVAFVALAYYGAPWKLRKNFFAGVEKAWQVEHDELMAKYGELLRGTKKNG